MADDTIPRRDFLKGAAIGTAAALTPLTPAEAQTPTPAAAKAAAEPPVWLTLNHTEADFITAAVDTLIPADDLSPSGRDCGVAVFIDRQLAGAFGNGARLYRQGPFLKAKPELGYQLALTPREFFRAGIAAANDFCRKTYGKDFDRLSPQDREAACKTMESGKADFPGFSSSMFFNALLQIAMEGFFADPIYGGNRDMVSWKMIGFPGARYNYIDWSERHNEPYPLPPVGLAGRAEWTARR